MALWFLLNISTKFPTNSPSAVSVECFCLNPCYLVKTILFVSNYFLACTSTLFSKKIGQKWQQGNWSTVLLTDSPPSFTGIILAIL